jgi:hypothetical protein
MKNFTIALGSIILSFTGVLAEAKTFPIFDGQTYNGLYYPRVDIIEWGEPFHLEFHVYYKKDKPIDLSAVVGEKGGRTVVWLNYDLKFRGERVCRHAPAPPQFRKGEKIYSYRDNSHEEYDNIYLTSEPMKTSKTLVAFDMEPYYICPNDETASNMPDGPLPPGSQPERAIASESVPQQDGGRVPASQERAIAPDASKREGKGLNVDYENAAMPFSF